MSEYKLKTVDELKQFLDPVLDKNMGMLEIPFHNGIAPDKDFTKGLPPRVLLRASLNFNGLTLKVDEKKDSFKIEIEGSEFSANGAYDFKNKGFSFDYTGSRIIGEQTQSLWYYLKDFILGEINELPQDYITSLYPEAKP